MTLTYIFIVGALFSTTLATEVTSIAETTIPEQETTTAHVYYVPVLNNETQFHDSNKNGQKKELDETFSPSDDNGPTESNEIENYPKVIDVNGTIEEVEQILAANPELPQLSRTEIIEILDNITTQDQTVMQEEALNSGNDDIAVTQLPSESSKTLKPENYKTHEDYLRAMRALMVVLPFNAKNLSESKIQELYTKAPIIRFIGENSEVVTTTTKKMDPSIVTTILTTTTEELQQTKYSNHHEVYHQPYDSQPIQSESNHNYESETKPITTLTTEQITTTTRFNHYNQRPNHHSHHRRRRPTTASTTEHSRTQAPEGYQNKFINQHYETTKLSPIEQPVTTVYPERTAQNYQSTAQQAVTTVYPERFSLQDGNIEAINQNHVQLQSSLPNKTQHYNGFQPNPSRKRTKPSSTTPVEAPSSTESTSLGLDLPSDMKNLLISFNVDDHLSKPQAPIHNTFEESTLFVTPSTVVLKQTGSVPEPTKYSSQYSASELIFEKVTTHKPVMRDDVKEILASIGLFPDKEKQDKTSVTLSTTAATTSTTTATPDIAAAAESLSPEMKDLLISFGLLPSVNDVQQPSYHESETESPGQAYDKQAATPVVDPTSYLNFKPLPLTAANENTDEEEEKYLMSSDMKQFLASFGLVPSSEAEERYPNGGKFSEQGDVHEFRSQKALKMEARTLTNSSNNITNHKPEITAEKSNETLPHVNVDMLTDGMKEILENLGFLPSTNLPISATKRKTSGGEGHIFNPSAHLASLNPTEEEAKRLTNLLDTIKKLMKENGTITQDEIDALNASISFILPPSTVEDSNKPAKSTGHMTNVLPILFVQKKQVNKLVPLDQIEDAPDPLSLEELLLVTDDNKNEVKRQQANNGSSSNSTEETTQDPGPSLTDLAASFGGGETAPDDASVDAALPTKKPNGLYFLLDWNTFLEVGGEEDGNRRVNLSFSPKLGNSRAFLPVTVP